MRRRTMTGYGATLLGLMEDEYYRELCVLCDFVGAETRIAGQAMPTPCG